MCDNRHDLVDENGKKSCRGLGCKKSESGEVECSSSGLCFNCLAGQVVCGKNSLRAETVPVQGKRLVALQLLAPIKQGFRDQAAGPI
jgi:hypothetical protein